MAFIDQKLKTAYGVAADSTSDQIIRQAIDFSGYGPRVGVEGIWKLSRCFSLYSSFAYSLLVAKEERDLSVIEPNGTDDTPFVDLHDSCWNLVSSIDWAVGVKFFEARCSCIDFDLTLGYEFHQYITPKGFLDFQEIDGATPFFDRHLSNLGFDGLFVRLGLVF